MNLKSIGKSRLKPIAGSFLALTLYAASLASATQCAGAELKLDWSDLRLAAEGVFNLNASNIAATNLKELLICVTNSSQPLHLSNGCVVGRLNLQDLEIVHRVVFESFKFQEEVDFSGAHCRQDLSFAGSEFKKSAFFKETKFDGALDISDCVFRTNAIFAHAEIADDLQGACAWFGGLADFQGFVVQHSASFSDRLITNYVPVAATTNWDLLRGNLASVTGLYFLGLSNCDAVLMDSDGIHWRLLDTNTCHAFSMWWEATNINTNIFLTDHLKVSKTAYFATNLSVTGAAVAKEFNASDTYFRGNVNFTSLHVQDCLNIDFSDFDNAVTMTFAKVESVFNANAAQFRCLSGKVSLYGLQCREGDFQGITCNGGIDFSKAAFQSMFQLDSARFPTTNAVNFSEMTVSGPAYFNGTKFAGPASFILMRVDGNFYATDAKFTDTNSRAAVKSQATNADASSFDVDFGSLKVGGFAFFNHAEFHGALSFRNADFQNLILDRAVLPDKTNSLRVEGMKFKRIRSVSDNTQIFDKAELSMTWSNLERTLVRNTPYTFEIYHDLEAYFQQEGQPDIADEVFLAGKARERTEGVLEKGSIGWWRSWVLEKTIGYGRRPGAAVIFSLGIISVGSLIFFLFTGPRRLRISDWPRLRMPGGFGDVMDSAWYTLDLFMPIIELGAKEHWKNRSIPNRVRYIGYLIVICGALLVPILLGYFAGLLK